MTLPLKKGTTVIIRDQSKTLMIHKDKNPESFMYGKYFPPGGKIEEGETPEQCAIREVFEETGLKVSNLKYRGRVLFDNHRRNFNGKPAKFNFLTYVYEASDFEGKIIESNEGSLEWINDSDILKLPIEKGDYMLYEWLEKGIKLNHRVVLSDYKTEYYDLEDDETLNFFMNPHDEQ
jgi:8-oxo-dGTP diphosphatase